MMFDRHRLRRVLDVQGRQVTWLADETGYRRETVSRLLSGQYEITEPFAKAAARALGIPVEFLHADAPETAAVA